MVNVNYSLTGANGDTVAFDYSEYILNPDFAGFGIPPAEVRIESSAGDGGVFRNTKRGVREVDLPITVLGTTRADVQTKLRRLSRLLNDTTGPTRLNASFTGGETVYLEGHYVGGAESQWGSSAGTIWNRWVITLQCPNPFWQSTTVDEFLVTPGNTGRGLLPRLVNLKLTSSQVFGVITVDNAGDVPAYPIWYVRGPLSNVNISNNGSSFGFNAPVLAGETITVNTKTGEVTDDLGTNRYSILNPAPKLFRIEPGVSSITVEGTNATPASEVRLDYSPLYEVVH